MHQSFNQKSTFRDCFILTTPQSQSTDHQLIYLNEHDENGALGIIINQPLCINIYNVMDDLGIPFSDNQQINPCVLHGGPQHKTLGLIMYPSSKQTKSSRVNVSGSKDMLQKIATGRGPKEYLLSLGHANWQPGQLEARLQSHPWLIIPANAEQRNHILFHTPASQRIKQALKLMGLEPHQLSYQVGHA